MENKKDTPVSEQQFTNRVSISELADITGIRRQTLSLKLTALELPFEIGKQNAKTYLLTDVLKKLFKGVTSASNDQENKLEQQKYRHQAAKTEKAELEVQKAKAQVVPIDEVIKTINSEYSYIRSQFKILGSSLARELSVVTTPEDITNIIDKKVEEVMEALKADAQQSLSAMATEVTVQVDESEVEDDGTE